MKKIADKQCPICAEIFSPSKNDRPNSWIKRIFCSSKCCNSRPNKGQFKDGHIQKKNSGSFKKGIVPWNWKGDKVGYEALHRWVSSHKGKPKVCEHCGVVETNNYKIHWANKSHKYFRDLNDWLRLCAKCHKKYDKK
jgi:hypothetical protein